MATYLDPLMQAQLNMLQGGGINTNWGGGITPGGTPGGGIPRAPGGGAVSMGMGGFAMNTDNVFQIQTGGLGGGTSFNPSDTWTNPNPDAMPLDPNADAERKRREREDRKRREYAEEEQRAREAAARRAITEANMKQQVDVLNRMGGGTVGVGGFTIGGNATGATLGLGNAVLIPDYSSTSEGYWESRPNGSTVFVRNGNGNGGGGGTGWNTGGGGGGGTTTYTPPPMPLPPSNSRIFTRLNYTNDVVEQTGNVITRGIWGNNGLACSTGVTGSMNRFYTASYQTTKQKEYYYDVLFESTGRKCDIEFSVTYGHYQGSGSYAGGGQLNDAPSRAIYSQYVLLTDTINKGKRFVNDNGDYMDSVYIINVSKDRMKDKLDPGNWELNLSELNGTSFSNSVYTGSNVQISGSGKIITLVDDSLDTDESVSVGGMISNQYKVYSGSVSNGLYSTGSHYGFAYPNLGVIVLDATKLNADLSFNTVSGSNVNGDNAYKLFTSISGSATLTGSRVVPYTFDARNVKLRTTSHYFLRVRNYEYNYSNNPTFIENTDGDFKHPTFVRDPKVFITSIGMYNDNFELLAIAKMSKPILKSFTQETSITVKLEY